MLEPYRGNLKPWSAAPRSATQIALPANLALHRNASGRAVGGQKTYSNGMGQIAGGDPYVDGLPRRLAAAVAMSQEQRISTVGDVVRAPGVHQLTEGEVEAATGGSFSGAGADKMKLAALAAAVGAAYTYPRFALGIAALYIWWSRR